MVSKNGIAVDCRLDNLQLIRTDDVHTYRSALHEQWARHEETLYWTLIQQVLLNPLDELTVGISFNVLFILIGAPADA